MCSETVCRRVIYHGRVQGVGFRATVRRLAHAPVTGVVRNLPDGTVEVVARGPNSAIREFLERIAECMAANIVDTDDTLCADCDTMTDFRIRY